MSKSTRFAIEVSPPKRDSTTQSERFKQTARELGCDPSEKNFNNALRVIAKQGPKIQESKKGAKKT